MVMELVCQTSLYPPGQEKVITPFVTPKLRFGAGVFTTFSVPEVPNADISHVCPGPGVAGVMLLNDPG